MTNQIASLSEAKLNEIFPGYFDAVVFPGLKGDNSGNKLVGSADVAIKEHLAGNGGNDVITTGPAPTSSPGQIATFGGEDHGDDTLGGTSGADVLVGGKGNNQIWGGLDNDYLYGDQLQIQQSSTGATPSAVPLDTISSADDGDDLLLGGSGNDFLHGGGGDANFLRGGHGNDTVLGDANSMRDVLIGYRGHSGPTDDEGGSDYLKSGGAPYTTMEGGLGSDVFDIIATGPGDYVKILDFSNVDGDKIKLPPGDSIAALYAIVATNEGLDWDWDWVATETDDGVTIPLDGGASLYLAGVEFDDLTIAVSAGTFEIT